jgi:hypothetical protein
VESSSGEEAEEGVLGGLMDIFLVEPRDVDGVPPPRFQVLRRVPWSYWSNEVRYKLDMMGLSLGAEIPRSWCWESIMGQPAYGGLGQ